MTIALAVRSGAASGHKTQFALDPASEWLLGVVRTRGASRGRISNLDMVPLHNGHVAHITGWVEQRDALDTVEHGRVEGEKDLAGNDRRRLRHHELHLDHAARGRGLIGDLQRYGLRSTARGKQRQSSSQDA